VTRAALAPIVALVVAGCGGPAPSSTAGPATVPPRPDVPEGWVAAASGDRSVSLVAPPDLGGIPLENAVLVQSPLAGAATPLEVYAVGPAAAMPQPRTGESLRAWLEAGSWIPVSGAAGVIATADVSEGEVQLPAGRAYRVEVTAMPGTPEESRVVAYAIATERGVGVLRMLGPPQAVAARAGELALVAMLVAFGPP
jgi:hypothetical protein